MRAFVIDHPRTPGAVRDLPDPEPGEGEVLVRVTIAGVNPIDWKIRDRYDGPFPKILGLDFAGIVIGAGNGVTRYVIDDRIFGIAHKHGTYAERTIVPQNSHEEPTAKIPESVGDADAAALPVAGLTALASLATLEVKQGTVVLITAAIGGVGGFASQIAHARGARVIGTVHSGKEDLARSLRVDDPIAYDRGDVAERVKALAPKGVDALLDLVSDGDEMKRLGETVRAGGKAISTIGSADVEWFKKRGVEATNLVMSQTPQSSHAGLRELLEMAESGTVRVTIAAERDLSDAAQALELSKSGSVDGKILLTVS